MSWFDYAVLGVLAVSIGWGIWRGLVREVMSLAAWVLAFLAASSFASPVADAVGETIRRADVRMLIAYILVFLGTLIVATFGAILMSRLMKAAGLVSLDRMLGALFGAARAVVIVMAFVVAAGLTALPQKPWWKESSSAPLLGRAALALTPWLPPGLAAGLRYH